jgi:hypothetical protein
MKRILSQGDKTEKRNKEREKESKEREAGTRKKPLF